MCQKIMIAFVALSLHFTLTAQVDLLPVIGIENEPAADTPICEIPTYLGQMDVSGYHVGELVNDFSLYSTEGERFQLAEILAEGKPVLLVSGNYTCWRYRDQLDALNAITNDYAEEMKVFIIYTVEAHPHTDLSPYSGTVWPTQRNFTDNVLYNQPTTYGERLELIADMRNDLAVVPEILVDDPCNQWWSAYGPAPNNVYLVDQSGIVRIKQPWLVGYPTAGLWCELTNYFDDNNPNCNEAGNNGSFSVTYDAESGGTVYGNPGEVLTVPTTIQNLSETENVVINFNRENVYVQPNWQTALCVNICYNYSVSEASVSIPPGGEQSFIFYFFTGSTEGVGTASVKFRNANIPGNNETLGFTAVTGMTTDIDESERQGIKVYPNPTSSYFQVEIANQQVGKQFELYDGNGRSVKKGSLQSNIFRVDVSDLPGGLYFLNIAGTDRVQQIMVK